MGVVEEPQGLFQAGFGDVKSLACLLDDSLRLPGLGLDALLFVFEQIEGNGLVVVGLDEFLSLVFEPGDSLCLLPSFFAGLVLAGGEIFDDVLSYAGDGFGGEVHGLVVVDDGLFSFDDGYVRLGAVGSVLLTADAVEVAVDVAVGASGVRDADAGLAGAAPE